MESFKQTENIIKESGYEMRVDSEFYSAVAQDVVSFKFVSDDDRADVESLPNQTEGTVLLDPTDPPQTAGIARGRRVRIRVKDDPSKIDLPSIMVPSAQQGNFPLLFITSGTPYDDSGAKPAELKPNDSSTFCFSSGVDCGAELRQISLLAESDTPPPPEIEGGEEVSADDTDTTTDTGGGTIIDVTGTDTTKTTTTKSSTLSSTDKTDSTNITKSTTKKKV